MRRPARRGDRPRGRGFWLLRELATGLQRGSATSVTVWNRLGIFVACGSLSKVMSSLTDRPPAVLAGVEHGEALGLHRHLERRDLDGPVGRAVGDEPERVAVEDVVLVLRRGDDEEAPQGGDVFQRGELRPDALAVAGVEGEQRASVRARRRARASTVMSATKRADLVARLAEADRPARGGPPSVARGRPGPRSSAWRPSRRRAPRPSAPRRASGRRASGRPSRRRSRGRRPTVLEAEAEQDGLLVALVVGLARVRADRGSSSPPSPGPCPPTSGRSWSGSGTWAR